jgi:hypothetical protein
MRSSVTATQAPEPADRSSARRVSIASTSACRTRRARSCAAHGHGARASPRRATATRSARLAASRLWQQLDTAPARRRRADPGMRRAAAPQLPASRGTGPPGEPGRKGRSPKTPKRAKSLPRHCPRLVSMRYSRGDRVRSAGIGRRPRPPPGTRTPSPAVRATGRPGRGSSSKGSPCAGAQVKASNRSKGRAGGSVGTRMTATRPVPFSLLRRHFEPRRHENAFGTAFGSSSKSRFRST